jgi:hypothetical protein
VSVTAVNNAEVEINAGSVQGVREGATLPILSNGGIVALARIQNVQPRSSTGAIVWRDETAAPLTPGLAVGMVGASGATSGGPAMRIDNGAIGVPLNGATTEAKPAASIEWETGLSNVVVPRADRTYQYLATLAANGLITRYPASLFRDDGRNYHRTEEDIAFTRAQITDLIREAVVNAEARGGRPNSSSALALAALAQEYSRELGRAGLAERVAAVASPQGFQVGFSGQLSATLVGGDTNNLYEPFSERQGGRRTKSGVDARLNLFGQISKNLTFFSETDAGNDYRNPALNAPLDDRNLFVRRALLSYDAGHLLRGLRIEAGRDEIWWGPGHFGTLSLGDTAGPLNLLRYEFKRGSYVAQGLYSPLGTGVGGKRRALYAKNNYVQLGNQTRLGFTETVLSPNDSFDPVLFAATASPLPLLVLDRVRDTRFGQAEDTNSSFAAYLETSVARGLQAYGELLIDDIGVNAGNQVRNRLGSLLGAHIFSPRDPAKIGAYMEYANLQGETYLDLRGDPDYDFYDAGRPFGYPVAPPQNSTNPGGGAESLRFDGYWRVTPKLRLGAGIEFADLQSEQPDRIRQQTYRLRAHYDIARNYTITARAQRVKTSQPAVAPAAGIPETSQNLLQLELSRAF